MKWNNVGTAVLVKSAMEATAAVTACCSMHVFHVPRSMSYCILLRGEPT